MGNVKKSILRTLLKEEIGWVQEIFQVTSGYLWCRVVGHLYLFELVYGVIPRLSSLDPSPLFNKRFDNKTASWSYRKLNPHGSSETITVILKLLTKYGSPFEKNEWWLKEDT